VKMPVRFWYPALFKRGSPAGGPLQKNSLLASSAKGYFLFKPYHFYSLPKQ